MLTQQSFWNRRAGMVVLLFLVLASRIPFLFCGYGVEEDSWGLVLNAYQMADTGKYIYSRLPGHPVQELALALMPGAGPAVFNGLSALFSVAAVLFFALILKKLKFRSVFPAGLALALTPVFYISSTYTIDYVWAAAFMLGAFYFMLGGRPGLAGLFLGLAAGCRMTSVLMLLPLLVLIPGGLTRAALRSAILLPVTAFLAGLACYLPALLEYGTSFIATYPQPYPPLPKVLYKGTIGVWGITGCLVLAFGFLAALRERRSGEKALLVPVEADRIRLASWLMLSIYTLLYLLLPEKSAFLVPVIPFVILLLAMYLKKKVLFWVVTWGLVLAPFFPDMNLTDPLRGSGHSGYAAVFTVSGQELYADPLSGPVFSDYSKRRHKAAFVEKALATADTLAGKTAILAGWWFNQIAVESLRRPANPEVRWVFYLKPDELEACLSQGFSVRYLPEQAEINDRRAGKSFTTKHASPLVIR